MKATHDGTCQVCGRFQKLPGGLLSKHGYTKQWGFFSGTCWGAQALPFELSKDLIEGAIARAQAEVKELAKESAELKAGKMLEGNTAWHNVYVRYTNRFMPNGYVWQRVNVFMETKKGGTLNEPNAQYEYQNFSYQPNGENQKIEALHSLPYGVKTLDGARQALNVQYAEEHLDSRVKLLKTYIKWQKERIADWKPTELKARKD